MQGSTKKGNARLANKLQGAVLGAFVLACAACVLAPGAALAGTLDQQQTDHSDPGVNVCGSSNQSAAQTFTAGRSGGLDQVDLFLSLAGAPSTPLNIEIRNVSGGTPGTTVLASSSVPASSIPGSLPETATFVPISFAAPATVAAGVQYTIVASTSACAYRWAESGTDSYGGGEAFVMNTGTAGSWVPLTGHDYTFRTYVTNPSAADKTPPETLIGSKKIKGSKATFTFTSSEPGSTFQCKLDKHSFRPCTSPKKYKHLSSGKHKFKVRAVDAAGNIDASPAKMKFTI